MQEMDPVILERAPKIYKIPWLGREAALSKSGDVSIPGSHNIMVNRRPYRRLVGECREEMGDVKETDDHREYASENSRWSEATCWSRQP